MIVSAADSALPHLFLRGFRAPPGQAVAHVPGDPSDPADDTVTVEEVGAFVARTVLNLDGSAADPGEVATEDVPYAEVSDAGPMRYESDIPVWKPEPDVIVVDALLAIGAVVNAIAGAPAALIPFVPPYDDEQAAFVDAALTAAPFGTVEVDRGAGFGAAAPLGFGWLTRGTGARLALAGDQGPNPWQLDAFDAGRFALPAGYRNGFQNGRALAGEAPFAPGDRLRLTDTTPIGPNVVTTVAVPRAPTLSVSRDGRPLDPPLSLTALADTVVLDRGAQQVLFVWRATFPWEARFENATLEVS